jgi:hypothetical protein
VTGQVANYPPTLNSMFKIFETAEINLWYNMEDLLWRFNTLKEVSHLM